MTGMKTTAKDIQETIMRAADVVGVSFQTVKVCNVYLLLHEIMNILYYTRTPVVVREINVYLPATKPQTKPASSYRKNEESLMNISY